MTEIIFERFWHNNKPHAFVLDHERNCLAQQIGEPARTTMGAQLMALRKVRDKLVYDAKSRKWFLKE